MSFLQRWFTEQGREDRLFCNALIQWVNEQIIPPAPAREFAVQLPFATSEEASHCFIRTTMGHNKGELCTAIHAYRTESGPLVVSILIGADGEYVDTIWP